MKNTHLVVVPGMNGIGGQNVCLTMPHIKSENIHYVVSPGAYCDFGQENCQKSLREVLDPLLIDPLVDEIILHASSMGTATVLLWLAEFSSGLSFNTSVMNDEKFNTEGDSKINDEGDSKTNDEGDEKLNGDNKTNGDGKFNNKGENGGKFIARKGVEKIKAVILEAIIASAAITSTSFLCGPNDPPIVESSSVVNINVPDRYKFVWYLSHIFPTLMKIMVGSYSPAGRSPILELAKVIESLPLGTPLILLNGREDREAPQEGAISVYSGLVYEAMKHSDLEIKEKAKQIYYVPSNRPCHVFTMTDKFDISLYDLKPTSARLKPFARDEQNECLQAVHTILRSHDKSCHAPYLLDLSVASKRLEFFSSGREASIQTSGFEVGLEYGKYQPLPNVKLYENCVRRERRVGGIYKIFKIVLLMLILFCLFSVFGRF